MLGPGSRPADAHALVTAVEALAAAAAATATASTTATATATGSAAATVAADKQASDSTTNAALVPFLALAGIEPVTALTPRDAFFARAAAVDAEHAVGRVSAELLCPYPPGVPVVFPGEVITHEALQALRGTLAAGGMVAGARDASLATLQVVVE